MPIASSDLKYYKSSGTDSTGGAISATEITTETLNNLFDDASASEAEAGLTDYRKLFVKNEHGSITWTNIVLWKTQNSVSDDDEVYLGLGSSDDDDGSSELSALTANAQIALVSSGADTRQVTLVGEDASGQRQTENVTLNGTTEALSVGTYSKLYVAYVSSTNSNTVTVKQGSGGTSRGTIAANKKSAILYVSVTTKGTGLKIGNLAAAASQGIWLKRVVAEDADAYSANSVILKTEGETS